MRISGRTPHDFISGVSVGVGGAAGGESAGDQISIRIPQKQGRLRRGRNDKGLFRTSLLSIAVFCLLLGLSITIFAFYFIFSEKDIEGSSDGRRRDDNDDYGYLFNNSVSNRELRFGQGSVSGGKDSRYWDKHDRRRDGEYDENDVNMSASTVSDDGSKRIQEGLYDEGGRNELKMFEDQYKESLHDEEKSGERKWNGGEVNSNDEYDDGIDNEEDVLERNGDQETEEHSSTDGIFEKQIEIGIDKKSAQDPFRNVNSLVISKPNNDKKTKTSVSKNKSSSKGKKHRSSCGMKLLDVTKLLEPIINNKSFRFSLQYKEIEERPIGMDNWEPRFAGHQSLQEREDSFYARDQKINCGFVKGPEGSPSTGFDLAEDDVKFMSSCHIAVSSCIFGNSDHLRTPYAKMITRPSRKNVCFVMFMDEYTLQALSSEGQKPDSTGFVGLWKIVVVANLPYADMRRVGKIPKFLTHRLFPSARYSIWLDSKLRLQSDPLLILEYFLWRKGHEYAISNHYDRHCVWEEVAQNKKLNKFNHTIIDQQFEFYQSDGLKRFDSSDPNRLLSSHVPEGSFIMRAHTPMSNLFSCLWFNEVERFTPRDQLSFAYTYLKLRNMNSDKPFHLNMFKDCERRSIAKLYRHRGENKRLSSTQVV